MEPVEPVELAPPKARLIPARSGPVLARVVTFVTGQNRAPDWPRNRFRSGANPLAFTSPGQRNKWAACSSCSSPSITPFLRARSDTIGKPHFRSITETSTFQPMSSKSKNRPCWRMRLRNGREPGCDAKFPVPLSHFGDQYHRQCNARARSTGLRCRKAALAGADRCASHAGHKAAYIAAQRELGNKFISLRSGIATARRGLAKLSTIERYPEATEWHPSPVERGRIIEEHRNRRAGLLGHTKPKPREG